MDILKPWPIYLAERLPGGLGIVADDIIAGVFAGLIILILVQLHVLMP
jgi:phosphatidylglycerophosphatase A